MRLFIAIDCEEKKEDFQKIQNSINKENADLKKTDSFHLTLKFLGKASKEKIKEITKKLKEIKFKKFDFKINNLGFFPNNSYVRVIWIGISPEKEVITLQKQIDEKLKEDFKEDFEFKPHITLARVKRINHREEFFKNIKQIKVKPTKIRVTSFKLYQSKLTPSGPEYEIIEEFKCFQE